MATPNALFAILNASNPDAIKAEIAAIAPWLVLELQEGQWLLIAPSATTTTEVSTRLGLTRTDSRDTGIVLRVETYFGRNYPTVWEWISTKQGAELGAFTSV